ncbi:MAG: hypothetical protein AAGO57_03885 [Pseudomonadota bacterium]
MRIALICAGTCLLGLAAHAAPAPDPITAFVSDPITELRMVHPVSEQTETSCLSSLLAAIAVPPGQLLGPQPQQPPDMPVACVSE